MKLAEVASISEDAFNLVIANLSALFRKAVYANISTQTSSKFVIRDPENCHKGAAKREENKEWSRKEVKERSEQDIW